MELKTRDDAQRFLHLMFKFAKTSTSSFALGATAKTIGNSTIWVWDHSGDEIEVCTHGCLLKTSSDSVDVAPQVGHSAFYFFNPGIVFLFYLRFDANFPIIAVVAL